MTGVGQRRSTVIQRFARKVRLPVAPGGCWEWLGCKSRKGYGTFATPRGESKQAHRFAYERFRGPIPDGLSLDHTCRNRGCVNPEHLEPVTTLENVRRGAVPKLPPIAVSIIRSKLPYMKQRDIAAEFGIAQGTVSQIARGVTWRGV